MEKTTIIIPLKQSQKRQKPQKLEARSKQVNQTVCKIGKDGKLYTFKVVDGKLKRVSNDYAHQCRKKNLPKCNVKKMCKKDYAQHHQLEPCRLKKTAFYNKKDVKDYCQLKKK